MSKTLTTFLVTTALGLAAAPSFAAPAAAAPAAAAVAPAGSCPLILKQTFKRLQDEAPQDLCQYAGKVVLVVNTASYCGYTSQYQDSKRCMRSTAARAWW